MIFLGQGKKFELWDETTWNKSRDEWLSMDNDNGDALPEEMRTLSI